MMTRDFVYGYESDKHVKTDVFISYKRDNIEFVSRLVQELEAHYISVWYDVKELPEHVGDEYKERIHQAIKNAQLVLFVYSEDTNKSDFIIDEEIGFASKNRKKICCYAYDPVNFNKMNSRLSEYVKEIQWLANQNDVKYILKAQEAIEDERKRIALANCIQDIGVISSEYQDVNLFLIRIAIQKILGYPTPYGLYEEISKSESDGVYKKNDIEIVVENQKFLIDIPEGKKASLYEVKFLKRLDDLKEEEREIHNLWNDLDQKGCDNVALRNNLKTFIEEYYSMDEILDWLRKSERYKNLVSQLKKLSFNDFIKVVSDVTADAFIEQIMNENKTLFNGAMLGVLNIQDRRTGNVEKHELSIRMYHSDYFTFKCTVEIYHILRSIRNKFSDIKSNISKYAPFLCSLGLGGFVVIEQEEHQLLTWAKRSNSISSGDMWHFSYDETVNLLKDCVRYNVNGRETIKIFEDNTIRIDPYKNFYRALKEEMGFLPDHINGNSGIVSIGVITSERLEIELLSFAVVKLDSSESIARQMRKFQHAAPDGYLEISKLEFKDIYDSVNNYIGRLLTPESYHLSEYLQQNKQVLLRNFTNRLDVKIDKTVKIGHGVHIGRNCIIEEYSTLSDNCSIGDNCKIHRNVFIDENVHIGNFVKIQNNNSIYNGVVLEDGVFVGTNVCFTNDRSPRSINQDGSPVTNKDWTLEKTIVKYGASIGAGAVIRCGVEIGEWAMVGCGAVVTKDVPANAVVVGNYAIKLNRE